MESLFSLPRPFQRRLTNLYTDTKSSYDFVKEPIQSAEDPEILALHRKLRIQKDRLVSWGLEWSESSQSPDIDESINKAGLSELVGSVMLTIKEILAETEPLWQSSKRLGDEKSTSSDRKPSLISWDKSRFQDLVRDLTMSIDTLYDLSRTRQSARKGSSSKLTGGVVKSKLSPAVEEKLFESSRMQTPQQIDPKSLIWPRDLKPTPAGVLSPAKAPRQIVFMRRPTTAPDARKHGGQALPIMPVLLEHAPYNPIYSITGISPSMTRFEKLFAALSQAYISADRLLSGLFRLIGYFEEPEQSRFCLLFALPTHFGPIDIQSPRIPSITMLSDLLYSGSFEPSLEVKYRLAYNVASSVFDLHAKGVVHGDIVASNVLFIDNQSSDRLDLSQVNMRQSYLASFDLFSDNATDSAETEHDTYTTLHRHPLDPRMTRYTRLTSESKSLDLYGLAMLLLEIGLWTSLSDIFPGTAMLPENPAATLKKLAAKCGSLYVRAVQACWHAPEDELSQKARPDVMHQKVFWKVSKALDTCCAIDDSGEEESDDSDDAIAVVSTPVKPLRTSTPPRSEKSAAVASLAPALPPVRSEKPTFTSPTFTQPRTPVAVQPPAGTLSIARPLGYVSLTTPANPTDLRAAKPKLKTYPAIRISKEHLDYWHTGLIPQINHVLRKFYKTHPESVEISLESVGETSATTKPTILVICTSVNKVRSILKKSLIYDTDVYGLKVCRGKVVRSRKQGVRRSMALDAAEVKPSNADHQERPCNGASLGAYVGERHLPPVSFGGMVIIDDKPYGLTVHHMLDDPSDDDEVIDPLEPVLRSSAYAYDVPDLTHSDSSVYSSGDEEYMYDLDYEDSDFGSEADESDMSDDDDESDMASEDGDMEPGDIKGIPAGCGEEYIITQPAIDDVPEDFFPSEETRDEDHLDSFQVGEVYASSGIRRRTDKDGIVHEIDWALFEFSEDRCPEGNNITDGHRHFPCKPGSTYPLAVAPVKDLSDLSVHCLARTSGLQTGRILPGMVIVKIYGRQTPSQSYQVAGKLGVPGDSGAWVVDNEQGRACGHVLAWSSRKRVAYICPMEVILKDIGETIGVASLKFPGGQELFSNAQSDTSLPAITEEVPRIEGEQEELSNLLNELRLPSAVQGVEGMDPSGSLILGSEEEFRSQSKRDDLMNYIPVRKSATPKPMTANISSIETIGLGHSRMQEQNKPSYLRTDRWTQGPQDATNEIEEFEELGGDHDSGVEADCITSRPRARFVEEARAR